MQIVDYRLCKLAVPCSPPISDSQTDDEISGFLYLELDTDTGQTGRGFGGVSAVTPQAVLASQFQQQWSELRDQSPFHLKEQMQRPRGGNYSQVQYDGLRQAIDVALWDLCGKHLDMPLYELLGGSAPEVPAYVSGLLFSQDDETVREYYGDYAGQGFDAAKVKVGYETVDEDIDRLALIQDVLGDDCTLMVDANEAWSPKEAIRRAHAYRDAGFDLEWIEDPVFRDDLDGIQRVVENVPFAHINTGEYVNFEGKRQLLERGACDVLNLRTGMLSGSLEAATLAHAYGVPTHVGHTSGYVGVHLAAALPELTYIEYWRRPWDRLLDQSVGIEDGHLIAPDRPGHGMTLAESALAEYGEDTSDF